MRNLNLEALTAVTVADPMAGAAPLFGSHVGGTPTAPGSYSLATGGRAEVWATDALRLSLSAARETTSIADNTLVDPVDSCAGVSGALVFGAQSRLDAAWSCTAEHSHSAFGSEPALTTT